MARISFAATAIKAGKSEPKECAKRRMIAIPDGDYAYSVEAEPKD